MRHWFHTIQPGHTCILLLLLACLQPAPLSAGDIGQHGLLWEIRQSGEPASYLFGTIHSEDPAVLALPVAVQQVFDAADRVVLETQLDLDAMLYTSQVMLLGEGRLLSDIAGASLFEKAARAIRTRGIPDIVLDRMKPWAAAVT
ncbi:MAG TPA: TraB/GumN family protein, partial [Gammaproteobacteria bacterium]|nr:TraB/GumN family protein [Gammaproteobacteria bacterium]